MKPHIVLKLRSPLADGAGLPDWVTFIHDKSRMRESVTPEIDRVLDDAGLAFWITSEYRASGATWSASERADGLDRTYRIIFQQDFAVPDDLVARLQSVPSVESARRVDVVEAELPRPALATSMTRETSTPDLIYLRYAKALTTGLPDIKIAVLDTGVNLDHPELRGKIAQREDFVDLQGLDTSEFVGDLTGYDDVPEDEVGHGTHVSGIIAGRGLQMDEGVAPGCRIMAIRVLATMKSGGRFVGAGILDNINTGIKWAVDNGANVINMSLGIKHTGAGLPHEDVIRYALGKNVTVVAASGNDGTAERYYPGALPGVIAVGAVDPLGTVTNFTSYGASITVVAPGVNIYSSFAHRTYALASGTSQASPFVAGAIGLMKSFALQQGLALTNRDITDILKNTSDKVDTRLRNEHAGYGLINLADAFKFLTHLSS